jgi:PAS domain S-box-containing protein
VEPADQPRPEPLSAGTSKRGLNLASLGLVVVSAILVIAVLVANFQSQRVAIALLISLISAIVVFALLSADVIRQLRRTERRAKTVFEDSEREFHQMADNIQEIFWVVDAQSRRAVYVSPAYETITGRSCQSLMENPFSYAEVIHSDDRVHVLAKLDEATRSGRFDERFRIVKPDGEIRWVWVRGFPGRDAGGNITRLGGTTLDITALKEAEDQVVANLAKANSAWVEAEALRKATLALTEDLHMDSVLDALLRSLAELVPYTCARVLVPEGGPHWLALGEKSCPEPAKRSLRNPLTFVADKSPFFERIWSERKRILIPDTRQQEGWQTFEGHKQFRSWLSVPLVASEEFLGFLSVGHLEPNHFTEDHLRRAELLAIPAAVAIQNARLYSTAEIYGSELEKRLADLQKAEQALDQSEAGRRVSEEKFEKIFHSSPVAFSITTLEEGRFLEVNAAFECRYGYRREEVLGRTVHELGIWDDPADRKLLIAQLRRGGPIRNVITRLRTRSGEVKLTAYSADRIQFDGKTCILAIAEDVVTHDPKRSN